MTPTQIDRRIARLETKAITSTNQRIATETWREVSRLKAQKRFIEAA